MLLSINQNFINKASSDAFKKYAHSFEPMDISSEELAEYINQGFAFCSQFKDGVRKSANFTASGFLAVDIDHGLTIEIAQADPYFQKYASILYTTPNHTEEKHRFRIVFELEEPITDRDRMQLALTSLIRRFGADGSCKDACRIFFGSSGSKPVIVGNRLPSTEVDVLIIRAHELQAGVESIGSDGKQRTAAVHSRIDIPRDTVVQTESGQWMPLTALPTKTRIFCCKHTDTRASAVTLTNRHGNPGFYCSACGATFFLEDGSNRIWHDEYRFDYHWLHARNLSVDDYTAYADDEGHVDLAEARGIQAVNSRYLTFSGIKESVAGTQDYFQLNEIKTDNFFVDDHDITLIKSPKGSGKTEWLAHLVREQKKAKRSVLLIGHRRSLITTTANRIGLTSYLRDSEECYGSDVPVVGYQKPTPHYAICLDSLASKLDPVTDKYDVVIIDEVEQVFAHLLSSTLKDTRREALHTLRHYLRTTPSLFLLDADLNRVTVDVLSAMLAEQSRSFQAVINDWAPDHRELRLYDGYSKDPLLGDLFTSLERGERCFVCSNSKKLIDGLCLDIAKRSLRELKIIVVTSDNSQSIDIQNFLNDIKIQAQEYDAILSSPAMGTGIDITFPEDAQLIDSVYGFFETRINSHFDIDQQLARVRNPKRINVWISPEEFQFETDAEAIKAEIHAADNRHRVFLDIDSSGNRRYYQDDLYEEVFSCITAAQRASKNRLKKNFVKLREANGWKVILVSPDVEHAAIGKEIRKGAKLERRAAEFDRILQAPQISDEQYREYRDQDKAERLRDADRPSMRRYDIEAFYMHEVEPALMEADNEGRLRESIRHYENLMSSDDNLRIRDEPSSSDLTGDRPEYLATKRSLVGLFETAGVMANGCFDDAARIESSQLNDFATACITQKPSIERRLNIAVRRDIRHKPAQQLGKLLEWVGLRLTKVERSQKDGESRLTYQLDRKSLDLIGGWVRHRADPQVRDTWEQHRAQLDDAPDRIPDEAVMLQKFLERKKARDATTASRNNESKVAVKPSVVSVSLDAEFSASTQNLPASKRPGRNQRSKSKVEYPSDVQWKLDWVDMMKDCLYKGDYALFRRKIRKDLSLTRDQVTEMTQSSQARRNS